MDREATGRTEELRTDLIRTLFKAFSRGATSERFDYYVKQTKAIALPDLLAAVNYAIENWDQQNPPTIATLRRWAGQAASQRSKSGQPVEPERARDVAIARIRDRGLAYEDQTPDEFWIWLEFVQFPNVLGRYNGPASLETQMAFAERFRQWDEERDRKMYGKVVSSTLRKHEEIAFLVDPISEPARRPEPPLTLDEKIEIWERQLAIAEREDPTAGKRIAFLRGRLDKLLAQRAKLGGDAQGAADPLADLGLGTLVADAD